MESDWKPGKKDCNFEDHHEFFRKACVAVAGVLLPPTVFRMIEERIPGARPGDMAAGKIVPTFIQMSGSYAVVKVYVEGTVGSQMLHLDLLTREDKVQIADALKLVAGWQRDASERATQLNDPEPSKGAK